MKIICVSFEDEKRSTFTRKVM